MPYVDFLYAPQSRLDSLNPQTESNTGSAQLCLQERCKDNLTDYLSEIGLDGEGNSLDTYARPIERCVRESSYSGKDGTQCYLYESEVE